MLFRQHALDLIAAGTVTLAFRRWQRPTVRAGGTLRTSIGVLSIGQVDVVDGQSLTEDDALRAGVASLAELLGWLAGKESGLIYRIELRLVGADPRAALREQSDLSAATRAEVQARLDRLDAASRTGPWVAATLALIARRPAVRAGDLAAQMGLDLPTFKRRVRQLKELGLTESLEVGYRLSPRGLQFAAAGGR